MIAERAGEQAAVNRWREELTFDRDDYIRDTRLRYLAALVPKNDVFAEVSVCGFVKEKTIGAVDGLWI